MKLIRLRINTDKTEVISFKKKNFNTEEVEIWDNNCRLKNKKQVEYLGYTFEEGDYRKAQSKKLFKKF